MTHTHGKHATKVPSFERMENVLPMLSIQLPSKWNRKANFIATFPFELIKTNSLLIAFCVRQLVEHLSDTAKSMR